MSIRQSGSILSAGFLDAEAIAKLERQRKIEDFESPLCRRAGLACLAVMGLKRAILRVKELCN